MFVFGHAGITLGAAVILRQWRLQPPPERRTIPHHSGSKGTSWLTSLLNHLDFRVVLLGSLLPDIIDKPVGQYFFRDTFSNGRIFSHTLLFLILLTLLGLYLYRSHGKTWLLVLAFGTFAHLAEDQIWSRPRTLLWPLYGFAFDRVGLTGWMGNMLYALLTRPGSLIPELVGLAILVWFALVLVRQRKVYAFIQRGQFLLTGRGVGFKAGTPPAPPAH